MVSFGEIAMSNGKDSTQPEHELEPRPKKEIELTPRAREAIRDSVFRLTLLPGGLLILVSGAIGYVFTTANDVLVRDGVLKQAQSAIDDVRSKISQSSDRIRDVEIKANVSAARIELIEKDFDAKRKSLDDGLKSLEAALVLVARTEAVAKTDKLVSGVKDALKGDGEFKQQVTASTASKVTELEEEVRKLKETQAKRPKLECKTDETVSPTGNDVWWNYDLKQQDATNGFVIVSGSCSMNGWQAGDLPFYMDVGHQTATRIQCHFKNSRAGMTATVRATLCRIVN